MHPLLPGAPVGTWSIPWGRQSIPLGCQKNRGELETPQRELEHPPGWLVPRGLGLGLGRAGGSSQAIAPGRGWDYGVSQKTPVWEGTPMGDMDSGVLYVGWYQDEVLGVLGAMSPSWPAHPCEDVTPWEEGPVLPALFPSPASQSPPGTSC